MTTVTHLDRHGPARLSHDPTGQPVHGTPRGARTFVMVHGETEPCTASGFRRPPASGWATPSGPARWRVLADWGRPPQLVRRAWTTGTAERWSAVFEQPVAP